MSSAISHQSDGMSLVRFSEVKQLRAAIYARVSTEDQAREGFSIAAQLKRLTSYCKAREWRVAGEYVDDGFSGRDTRRPQYQRMMSEKDQWDVLVVLKMDRIHRNSQNFTRMMDELTSWGKQFNSMQESFDTTTAIGRFVMDIIQRIAQLESEQIGERTYMGMAQKAESGSGLLGFNPPYGYNIQHKDLSIVPEEAEVVQDIFARYLRGETMAYIAWTLNREEVLTRRGNPWTVWSISHMLHNPAYAGWRRWDHVLVPSSHPAIVEKRIFNDVQFLIASRVKNRKHKKIMELPD